MATWSAPGKIFLFGEHAVVYGKPGLAMAIKPRVHVTVRRHRNPAPAKSPYIDQCFRELGVRGSVYVSSQMPSSAGLGSSAAVTVATLSAANDEFELGLEREEIAAIGHRIEQSVQKGRASPTDTYVSTMGGLVLIMGDSRRRIPPANLNLVIGNTQVSHSTSRMVELVAEERERRPGVISPILEAIGALTLEGLRSLDEPRELGRLMNVNHALLDAIGVGHTSLTRLVLAARGAGAFGAKLTGAGGGGCMIALSPKNGKTRIAGALDAAGGRAFVTTIDTAGVRKEHDA
ncbi:MAG TPA: mevalonate kinase [Methanoregulaceae archaeon]|nr:mevalonate kinase [Methanoregulaceae archaeon]HQJ87363.1 mevalonate kinase [Methanoregulaceae archaeon]